MPYTRTKGGTMAFIIMPCKLRATTIGTQDLARIPVLYDRNYQCHAPASQYLMDIGRGRWIRGNENCEAHAPSAYARKRIPSDGSIVTYGRQIEHFITHCERRRINWRELDYQGVLDRYVNPMVCGRLAPSTINGRFHTAVDFLTWAANAEERGPFEVVVEVVASDPRKSAAPRRRLVGGVRPDPGDLSLPERSAIEEWLTYLQTRDSHTANVDALMCWTLLRTALRAEEILRLRVSCLQPVKRDCQEFRVRAGCDQVSENRSSNRMASWAFAMPHSRGGIFQSLVTWFKTRNSSFSALSSVGKWPRVRTARRSFAFSASMAFVV